jgi:hypothetical protein
MFFQTHVGGSHIIGLVDPIQPNRTVPKNTIHGSLPTIAHPQKKKANKPMDEDYLAKKLEKYEQTYGRSNKHNNGKNCCDSFWWVLVSAIIFAIGAYVSKPLLIFYPNFKWNPGLLYKIKTILSLFISLINQGNNSFS